MIRFSQEKVRLLYQLLIQETGGFPGASGRESAGKHLSNLPA